MRQQQPTVAKYKSMPLLRVDFSTAESGIEDSQLTDLVARPNLRRQFEFVSTRVSLTIWRDFQSCALAFEMRFDPV